MARNFLLSQIRILKHNIAGKKVAFGGHLAKDVKIGAYTRINGPSHIEDCEIGKFCAIGRNLTVRSTNHSMEYLNLQKFAQEKIIESTLKIAGIRKNRILIGNNVWIGDSVILLPGVRVGNGAVIAAGSVVTKSVPEFSIVGGNPARVIRYRFNQNTIKKLRHINWWDWSPGQLKNNAAIFEINLAKVCDEGAEQLQDFSVDK